MAIGGGAKPGQWLQVRDGALVRGRMETTMVTESDHHAAIARILAGERVCVDLYRQMHMDLADIVEGVLTRERHARRDDVTHALCNAGALV
jgi:hypothetical protein